MTGDAVTGSDHPRERCFRCTALNREWATGVKPAAGWRSGGAGWIAHKKDALSLALFLVIGMRHGRQKRFWVRMLWVGEQFIAGSHLYDLAEIHHRDTGADHSHDREIVGNEQVRQPETFLQVAQ